MECDTMQPTATLDSLSPAQFRAVEALLAGKTITAAASAGGVDRGTVHRWLKDDFAFQAELNRARREMRGAAFGNLERLAVKAGDCLEKALDQGDVRAALEVLKRLKLFTPPRIGSEDPEELAAEVEVEAAERKAHRDARAMDAEHWAR